MTNTELTRSVRRRINKACDEFEDAWISGACPRIADFLLHDLDQDAKRELFEALLDLEFHYRDEKNLVRNLDSMLVEHAEFESVIRGKFQLEQQKSTDIFSTQLQDTSILPGDEAESGKRASAELRDVIPQEHFGRYRIIRTLGTGGMGAVYLAEDTVLHRNVALKIPRFADDNADMIERFRREAKSAAVIQHRNICPIFDIGSENGQLYITMAFIDGKPLSEFINPEQLPDQIAVAKTIRKLAMALDEAHRLGIVHRDLKPANVMIDSKGEPVLMDFGLARQESVAQQDQLTKSGMIVGTPAYMSPEQIRDSGTAGPSADIYSLGIIMFQLLTGELPFSGDLISIITKIMMELPSEPSAINVDVDPRLEAICLKAIEKKPEDRFDSMTEFANELKSFIRNVDTVRMDSSRSAGRVSDTDSPTPVLENVEETFEEGSFNHGLSGISENMAASERHAVQRPAENLEPIWRSTKQVEQNGSNDNDKESVREADQRTLVRQSQSQVRKPVKRYFLLVSLGVFAVIVGLSLSVINWSGSSAGEELNLKLNQLAANGARFFITDNAQLFDDSGNLLVNFSESSEVLEGMDWNKSKSKITVVDLAEKILPSDEDLEVVMALPSVRHLNLKFARISDQSLEAIASSELNSIFLQPHFIEPPSFIMGMPGAIQPLTSAKVMSGPISLQHMEQIGAAEKLVRIDVENCGVGDEHLRHFVGLKNLRTLNIRGNPMIKGPGLEYLKNLPNLKVLYLDVEKIDKTYLQQLNSNNSLTINPDPAATNELVTPGNIPGSAELNQLLEAGAILYGAEKAGLSEIDGKLEIEGIREYKPSDNSNEAAKQIVFVDLMKNLSPTDRQLEIALSLPSLMHLELDCDMLTPQALAGLAHSNVQSVSLIAGPPVKARGNSLVFMKRISDEQLQSLGKAKQLVTVGLTNSRVDDEGLKHLAQLHNLKSLDLRKNKIEGPGLEYLRELPNLAVLYIDPVDEIHLKWLKENKQLNILFEREQPAD